MKFVWNDAYSVKVHEIDDQHKKFFLMINEVYDLLENLPVTKEALIPTFQKLADYAFYHLDTEEKYFDEFHFEGKEEHLKYHKMYRETMQDYIDKITLPDVDAVKITQYTKEIADYAQGWLMKHILIEDQQYTSCFQSHGLK